MFCTNIFAHIRTSLFAQTFSPTTLHILNTHKCTCPWTLPDTDTAHNVPHVQNQKYHIFSRSTHLTLYTRWIYNHYNTHHQWWHYLCCTPTIRHLRLYPVPAAHCPCDLYPVLYPHHSVLGMNLCPHCMCQDQSLLWGIWAIRQGWWGQWARSEVWPYQSHFWHSWGFGKSTLTICFQHTDPEM